MILLLPPLVTSYIGTINDYNCGCWPNNAKRDLHFSASNQKRYLATGSFANNRELESTHHNLNVCSIFNAYKMFCWYTVVENNIPK